MQLVSSPALDYANGAVWHLQRGLEHYRTLEVERGSNFGNPQKVRELERLTGFELGWAIADLDRATPAVDALDHGLAERLRGVRFAAWDVVDRLASGRYSSTPPHGLLQGLRDAGDAARLLSGR